MKKLIEKLKAMDKGTLVRTIALVIAIANQVVAVIGASSFASAGWYQTLSLIVTIVTAVWTAWKNNDFTFFARLGSRVLHALKDGKLTKEEVLGLFKDEEPEAPAEPEPKKAGGAGKPNKEATNK